jgi:hypothetical protein
MRSPPFLPLMICLAACGVEGGDPTNAPTGTGAPTGSSTGTGTGDVVANQLELIKSGARLRARLGRTSDGAQGFLGWYDQQLGAPCVMGPATDGKLRCVPGTYGTLYYSDARCQTAIVLLPGCLPGAPLPPMVQAYDTDRVVTSASASASASGTVAMRAFRGLRDYAGPVYVKSGANCTDLTASVGALGYRKVQGTEVAPSEMAEVNEVVE